MTSEQRTDECLKELFRNVYRVQELTSQLTRQSAALGEISVNAAIAAGHTGTQSKVFSEIAKQIGVISTLLLGSIERVHKFTGPMTSQSLEALRKSSERQKLIESYALVSGDGNRLKVAEVREKLSSIIFRLLDRSEEALAYARLEQEQMKQIINRVWSISISLRISASMAETQEQAFFISISEALEKMATETATLVEGLTIVLSTVGQMLTDRCQCMGGEVYAA